MSGIFAGWALNKGLGGLEAVLRTLTGGRSFQAAVHDRLDLIESKLDLIVGAPFRQAIMYLREGQVERCREKLIEAMSLNELDLPAAALYCSLIAESKPHLALEYVEDILRKFGAHQGVVPTEILPWVEGYIKTGSMLGDRSFELIPEWHGFYPKKVYCSPWNVVVHWGPVKPHGWFRRLIGEYGSGITAHNWRGEELLRRRDVSQHILAVTGEYIVVHGSADNAEVWNIARNATVPHRPSVPGAKALFRTSSPAVTELALEWPHQRSASFGPAILRSQQHEYSETVTSTSQTGSSTSNVRRACGMIAVHV